MSFIVWLHLVFKVYNNLHIHLMSYVLVDTHAQTGLAIELHCFLQSSRQK